MSVLELRNNLELSGSGLIVPSAFLVIGGSLALASYAEKKNSDLYNMPAMLDKETADTGALLSIIAVALLVVVMAAGVAMLVIGHQDKAVMLRGLEALKAINIVGLLLGIAAAFLAGFGLYFIYDSTLVSNDTRNTASDDSIDFETVSWVMNTFGILLMLFLACTSSAFALQYMGSLRTLSSPRRSSRRG